MTLQTRYFRRICPACVISTLRPENTNRNVNKCSVTRGFDFVFGFLGVSGIVNIVKHELVCNIHTILLSITIIDLFFFFSDI